MFKKVVLIVNCLLFSAAICYAADNPHNSERFHKKSIYGLSEGDIVFVCEDAGLTRYKKVNGKIVIINKKGEIISPKG